MWKAITSALLEDALKYDEETEQGMSRKLHEIIKDLWEQLGGLTISKHKRVEEQMSGLIQEALDLDKLFSKQIADISWTRGLYEGDDFDEESMELQQGEKRTVDGQQVQLVVAPALIKKGRSTGEDYGTTNMLLKYTVSCELLTSDRPGGSHKPRRYPGNTPNPGHRSKICCPTSSNSQKQSLLIPFGKSEHEGT